MIGITLASLDCCAEWLYTDGLQHGDFIEVQLAARLFPFDVKFRHGPAEFVSNSDDHAFAVVVLLEAQQDDPYSAPLALALMGHMVRLGDHEGADEQFRRLYRLAPHSEIVKEFLSRRRDP